MRSNRPPLASTVLTAGRKCKKLPEGSSMQVFDIFENGWLRELDLNQRPSGYEPDELPDCSIPRHLVWRSSLMRPEGRVAADGQSALRSLCDRLA